MLDFPLVFIAAYFQHRLETQRYTIESIDSYTRAIFQLFNDAASFLGLIGMLIGAGHVVAGSVFVFGAEWINKLNRIVLLSM